MDCTSARLLLILSGREGQELAPTDQRVLDEHLDACPDCAELARGERKLDQAVGRAMAAVSVPAGLKSRILGTLARHGKPRYWPWVAAAASLLIAAGLGLYFYLQPATRLNAEQLVEAMDPTWSSPEEVEKWFAGQGLKVPAPRQFDYKHLDSIDIQVVQGRRVAHMLFVHKERRGLLAHVYIMPAKALDVSPESGLRIPGSRHNIEFIRQPADGDQPEFVYMVAYTGGSMSLFLP
jgi:hypothetical protein